MTELKIAEHLARDAHAGQVEESTGDDYIHHVERVVALVPSAAKAIAWLHDVIEELSGPAPAALRGRAAVADWAVVVYALNFFGYTLV